MKWTALIVVGVLVGSIALPFAVVIGAFWALRLGWRRARSRINPQYAISQYKGYRRSKPSFFKKMFHQVIGRMAIAETSFRNIALQELLRDPYFTERMPHFETDEASFEIQKRELKNEKVSGSYTSVWLIENSEDGSRATVVAVGEPVDETDDDEDKTIDNENNVTGSFLNISWHMKSLRVRFEDGSIHTVIPKGTTDDNIVDAEVIDV